MQTAEAPASQPAVGVWLPASLDLTFHSHPGWTHFTGGETEAEGD